MHAILFFPAFLAQAESGQVPEERRELPPRLQKDRSQRGKREREMWNKNTRIERNESALMKKITFAFPKNCFCALPPFMGLAFFLFFSPRSLCYSPSRCLDVPNTRKSSYYYCNPDVCQIKRIRKKKPGFLVHSWISFLLGSLVFFLSSFFSPQAFLFLLLPLHTNFFAMSFYLSISIFFFGANDHFSNTVPSSCKVHNLYQRVQG